MKRYCLFLFLAIICNLNAQIPVLKAVPEKPKKLEFDSSRNFFYADELPLYYGQEMFILPKGNKMSYVCFKTFDFNEQTMSRFSKGYTLFASPENAERTIYDSLACRTFVIDTIVQIPLSCVFYLHDKNNPKLKCKFVDEDHKRLGSVKFEHSMVDYVLMSYFEYYDNKFKEQEVICSNKSIHQVDLKTGDSIVLAPNGISKWTAKGLMLNEQYCSLVLLIEDSNNRKSYIPLYAITDGFGKKLYCKREWDALVMKYGEKFASNIILGHIQNGMTEETVIMSWGKPAYKNKSSAGPDQWVYRVGSSSRYVYIEDGIVVGWN